MRDEFSTWGFRTLDYGTPFSACEHGRAYGLRAIGRFLHRIVIKRHPWSFTLRLPIGTLHHATREFAIRDSILSAYDGWPASEGLFFYSLCKIRGNRVWWFSAHTAQKPLSDIPTDHPKKII